MLSAARAKALLCMAVCVPSLTAIVTCPSGLRSSGLSQFSGFPSGLVWGSGIGKPETVVVKAWVPAPFTDDMLIAYESPAWVVMAPDLFKCMHGGVIYADPPRCEGL